MIRKAALTVLLAGALLPLAADDVRPLEYRFDEVKSKVLRLPGGDEKKETKVAVGDVAAGGDVVTTGFWARTVVSVPEKKTRFEISSSSRAKLQGDEPGVLLVLQKGRLKAIFDALTDGPPVERRVAAPGALLAVRGTRYGLEVGNDGETLLVVFEGTVEVFPTSAPNLPALKVHANELLTFGPRSAPRPPTPMRDRGMDEKSWGRREGGGPGGPGDGRPEGQPGRGPGQPGPGQPGSQQPGGQPPMGGQPPKHGH